MPPPIYSARRNAPALDPVALREGALRNEAVSDEWVRRVVRAIAQCTLSGGVESSVGRLFGLRAFAKQQTSVQRDRDKQQRGTRVGCVDLAGPGVRGTAPRLEPPPAKPVEPPSSPEPVAEPKPVAEKPIPPPPAPVVEHFEEQLPPVPPPAPRPEMPAAPAATPAPTRPKAAPAVRLAAVSLSDAQAQLGRGNITGALDLYGRLIRKGKSLEEIIRDLRDALYRYPVEVPLWQSLGDAYMRANRLQEALDAYTKAEELLR